MTKTLRIAVADDEVDMRDYFARILPRLGHEVVVVAENGRQLVDQVRQHQIDLIITDIKMPEMDGIEAANELAKDGGIPVILVSAFHDPNLIERAERDHVLAYLVKPIKQADLETSIVIATRRFEQFQALRKETTDLRQALADRKVIERAKGILMRRTGTSEQDAFRRLQKIASEKNKKLIDVANSILLTEAVIECRGESATHPTSQS